MFEAMKVRLELIGWGFLIMLALGFIRAYPWILPVLIIAYFIRRANKKKA